MLQWLCHHCSSCHSTFTHPFQRRNSGAILHMCVLKEGRRDHFFRFPVLLPTSLLLMCLLLNRVVGATLHVPCPWGWLLFIPLGHRGCSPSCFLFLTIVVSSLYIFLRRGFAMSPHTSARLQEPENVSGLAFWCSPRSPPSKCYVGFGNLECALLGRGTERILWFSLVKLLFVMSWLVY